MDDGDLDIIAASSNDDKITWFENDGAADPSFALSTIATSADGPSKVHMADLDSDGDLDIISASFQTIPLPGMKIMELQIQSLLLQIFRQI